MYMIPFYEEIINFYENINTSSIDKSVNRAKDQGLNCSFVYVQTLINNKSYVYELMGFNSIDKGYLYFSQEGFEQVYPKIDESFYKENHIVNDIIHIW